MDRGILFRCWDKHNKEMLKVEKLQFEFNDVFIKTNKYGGYFTTNEIVLMQYTGIRDKNGTKVFEGDIVKYYLENCTTKSEKVGVVEYFEASFGIVSTDKKNMLHFNNMSVYVRGYEVIGNIYDNPELLTH